MVYDVCFENVITSFAQQNKLFYFQKGRLFNQERHFFDSKTTCFTFAIYLSFIL